jgi:hypothetical protein
MTDILSEITVFWDMPSRSLVDEHQGIGGTPSCHVQGMAHMTQNSSVDWYKRFRLNCCLHCQGKRGMCRRVVWYMSINVSEEPTTSIFRLNMGHQVPPNMEIIYQITRRHIPQGRNIDTAMRASKLTL